MINYVALPPLMLGCFTFLMMMIIHEKKKGTAAFFRETQTHKKILRSKSKGEEKGTKSEEQTASRNAEKQLFRNPATEVRHGLSKGFRYSR
jgi:hypothetical protein